MIPQQIEFDYEQDAIRFAGEFADKSDFDEVIDHDAEVYAPDGALSAMLLCDVIPTDLHLLAYELWKEVDSPLSNRPTATGATRQHRSTNKFGVPSPRTGTNERVVEVTWKLGARQGVLGWNAKEGGLTKDSLEHREMLDGNRRLIELVDDLYKEHLPTAHSVQRGVVKANADRYCRRWHTAFSNVYVLKQWATPYHRDTNNLHGVPTAIICCGEFSGAELVLPRWRIALAYKPGDLLLFDPQQLHGVLQFEGERLSAAFYCARHVSESILTERGESR